MNPAQITRFSHSFHPDVSSASCEADNNNAQSPQQGRTQAFLASGELSAVFGRTSSVQAQQFTSLLGTLQRMLKSETPSFRAVAELGHQLAEAAMVEQGGHWLHIEEQSALKKMIVRCANKLSHMPASDASHEPLAHLCEHLKMARLRQSTSQMIGESHLMVRGVPDLLALIHLDPKVLADKPTSMPSCVKFGIFICTAKDRTAKLSENLSCNSAEVALLLHPHTDTLLHLERLPDALSALIENCPDASIQDDLHSLGKVAGELVQQLRGNNLLPRTDEVSSESGKTSVRSREVSESKLVRVQALQENGGSVVYSQKATGIYAEKERASWTQSTSLAGRNFLQDSVPVMNAKCGVLHPCFCRIQG